jgi:hypothetical protein
MSNKSKHFLLLACKILVILSCLGYLTWQLQSDLVAWDSMLAFGFPLPVNLFFVLPVLSIVSWFVESYKWQLLVRDLRVLRFCESVIHNLTAQAASFITPLKAGEFATKAFYFETALRTKVLKAVLVGNLSQMTVTVVLGTAGIALLFDHSILTILILTIGVVVLILLSPTIARWFKFKGVQIGVITFLSFVRYLIFSGSWLLLLYATSDVSIWIVLGSISAMYLAASIIPTLQIFDVFLKWSIASFFVGFLDIPIESMIAIVTIIWLNNTVLPVLLGCGILAFQRFPKVMVA